jgi:polysaccharide biosynthesis/export protein
MKKYAFVLLAVLAFGVPLAAQQTLPVDMKQAEAYLLGPGDEITVKVHGEDEFSFATTIGEDGKIEVPFSEDTLTASCKTQQQLKADIKDLLSKYLRKPMFSVSFKPNRPPVAVYGEVRDTRPVILMRKATLVEVLATSGGVTEDAGGMVQVFRTRPAVCADAAEDSDWKNKDTPTDVPSRMFSLASIREGKAEANTMIYPGDVIWVRRASPVYVHGEVVNPQGVYIKEDGLTLTEAIAKLGGVRREAKTKDIKIYRLKPNSKEREVIAVNYDLIKKGQQKDVLLEPYDIVEVDKAKDSIAKQILNVAIGAARTTVSSLSGGVGYRVLY